MRKIFYLVLLFSVIGEANVKQFVKITNISVQRSVQKNETEQLIDIQFDKPFSAKQLKPEYERNFIQLVFKSTKMDSARIIPAVLSNAGGGLSKIFAYAYTPDTSRIRLIFNSDNPPRGQITLWNTGPKTIRIQIKERSVVTAQKDSENKLLKEVTDNTRDVDLHNPDTIKQALALSELPVISAVEKQKKDEKPKELTGKTNPVGTRTEPSKYFVRMILALLGVLGLFFAGIVLVRRYSNKLNKLPFGKKERIIQVIATHYIGNKKSISLVRVAGEYMVVGVGNDGMTLLSKLDKDADVDKYLDERFWGGTFEKHLRHYERNEVVDAVDTAAASAVALAEDGVKDKVELSAAGSSLREKLSKLKPNRSPNLPC